jgi:NAD(P)-dependent dehydrogenase (short-subunit alcohol dehydrogenase family)
MPRLTVQPVTGGAQGLGRTIARGLLEHGAEKVALVDIDVQEGEAAVASLVELFPDRRQSIIFRQLDVTDAASVQHVTSKLSQFFDGIDILTCFAGTVNSVRVTDYTPEQFRNILDVNTTGTFLTAQAVARYAPSPWMTARTGKLIQCNSEI